MSNPKKTGTLTDTYLKYGIVPVGRARVQLGLPAPVAGSVKIAVLFDDGKKSHELVYDPVGERFFGVKGWFDAHKAVKGDQVVIETVESGQLYRFRFAPKSSTPVSPEPLAVTPPARKTPKSVVGEPINYRGLVYAPVNEQGVVLLFGMLFEELGMIVEEVKTGFPDATIRRFNGKGWLQERVEFEYVSKNFKLHKHPVDGCDIIVCWKHNWKECPLEVIDLEQFVPFIPANEHARS